MAFIPLHDSTVRRHIRWPFVSWGLIALNTLIFLFLEGGGVEDVEQASVASFGLIPATFSDIAERPSAALHLGDHLTLVTYAFLHGDVWHLLGNMVFVWVFADNVEDSLGHVRFLVFYLLCAIGAGYAYVLADPGSLSPVIGASGAVAGVIAAYLMLHPFGKVWILAFGRIPLRLGALWVLGFWIVYQAIGALIAEDDQIAWVSHVGGVIVGAALVPLLKRRGVKLFQREPAAVVALPSQSVDGGNPPR